MKKLFLPLMNNVLNKAIDWLCLFLFFILISFPIFQIFGRYINFFSIPASQEIVQHMTLWIGFVGAVIAARSNRLLSIVREPVFNSLEKVSLTQFLVHIVSLSVVFVLSVFDLRCECGLAFLLPVVDGLAFSGLSAFIIPSGS